MRWKQTPEDAVRLMAIDEPWCVEFDEHDCTGADCLWRPSVHTHG